MEKNKTGKYLKYAVGEIILVVIGIVIALSINNWNEKQKETGQLHGFLQNISNNIKADRVQLESMIEFRDSITAYSGKILAIGKQKNITISDFSLLTHNTYNAFYDKYLEIHKSGFDALKNSGYIEKVQNTKIENLLNKYYQNVNIVEKQEISMNDFIENMEVLGFEKNVFPKILDVLENPDIINYFRTNPNDIRKLMTNPIIIGANLRSIMTGELRLYYKNLILLGEEIRLEIQNIVDN